MFQHGKTVLIYGEYEGSVDDSFKAAAEKVYRKTDGELRCGTTCRYYLESNPYDNKDHIQQKFIYYLYEEY